MSEDAKLVEQGQCPSCEQWFDVEQEVFIVPYDDVDSDGNETVDVCLACAPTWWKDNTNGGGCPGCGSIILVESECNFRRVSG